MPSARNILGALIAGLLLSGFLSSCGGGDGGSATASEPLTKTQFIKRASAICEQVGDEIEPRLKAAVPPGESFLSGSRQKLVKLAKTVVIPLYQEVIAELAALSPPAGDRQADELIHQLEATLRQAESHPAPLLDNDPFAKLDKAAGDYGIEGCIF
jgi:hypothetical protein